MSRRKSIVNKLVTLVKTVNGAAPYKVNLYNNVYGKLKFPDEVSDWPSVFIYSGDETREYLPSGVKWGWLTVPIKIYVNTENPQEQLEDILEDIEYVLDNNNNFEYATGLETTDIRILSITTDQGILAPLGIGEMIVQIQYEI